MRQDAAVASGSLPEPCPDELRRRPREHALASSMARERINGLLQAAAAIGSDLHLETILRRVTRAAVALAQARCGALGVIGEDGKLAGFVTVGVDEAVISQIARGRCGAGLLAREPQPVRLAGGHCCGPAGRLLGRSFLGVPVRVRGSAFGNLYLIDKAPGGPFTGDDEAVVCALAAVAAETIENARLHEEAQRRQCWLEASGEVTTRLLSGADPEQVLGTLTARELELSGADLAMIALPDCRGDGLVVEHADGDGAAGVRGLVLPAGQSLSGLVLQTGHPQVVADFAADSRAAVAARAAMSHIGPAVVFPLGVPGSARGAFTIGRRHGQLPFPRAATEVAGSFAAQSAHALELADRRRAAEQVLVLEDRDRIARDLQDQVIQRLCAAGMVLEGTIPMIARTEAAERTRKAVESVDKAIRDIRAAIFPLHSPGQDAPTVDRSSPS